MPRPRLLFLCQTLPFPPDGGVAIRTYNIFRLLAETFDVTALCFYRWKGGAVLKDVEASVAALRRFGAVEAFPIPQEHSRWRLLADHARSLVTGRAYTEYTYASARFARRLRELLATQRFDLVHVDSLDLSAYLPQLAGMRVVCVHHNVESVLLGRRAEVERHPLLRRYMRHQAKLTEREERRWCGRVALNVTVSEDDRALLTGLVPEARTAVVPNGVDVHTFRPEAGREEGIVFVGGTTWFPNRDALAYFAERILPLLRAGGVQAPVTWVGRASEAERERYRRDHGIELTGYVDDIRPYVRDAACYVVPLRVGGGTRLKILDAWAMGKPMVSTSIGCEGLRAVDGENLLIRDTPEAFAEAVGALLADAGLRRRLAAGARSTAEQVYSWEKIGAEMTREYLAVIGAGECAPV